MIIFAKKDDNPISISKSNTLPPSVVSEINGLAPKESLMENEEILLRTPTRVYNVRKGDTLSSISSRFGVDVNTILRNNPELEGRSEIYEGQLLVVKYPTPTYGSIIVNGFYYYGCSLAALIAALPHLSCITVAAAFSDKNNLKMLFDDSEVLKVAKEYKKSAFLRIYGEFPHPKDNLQQMLNACIIMAKSKGYDGLDIVPSNIKEKDVLSRLMLEAKKNAIENDLLLLCECNAKEDCSFTDYADITIARYDKSANKNVESFEKGERKYLSAFADKFESASAVLDISPFAYSQGKYLQKSEMLHRARKKNGKFSLDSITLECSVTIGEHTPKEYRFEGLCNLEKRLKLISELGFMGVSVDINRTQIAEIMLIEDMFYPIEGNRGVKGRCLRA